MRQLYELVGQIGRRQQLDRYKVPVLDNPAS